MRKRQMPVFAKHFAKQCRKTAGFSLIELLAVVAITAILSVVTIQIIVSGQLRGSQSEGVSGLRQEADFVMDQLGYTIRNARSVSCASATELEVKTKNNTTIVYTLDGTRLASNSAFLTSTGIELSGLSFLCTSNDSTPGMLVDISFVLTNRFVSPPFSQPFHTTVYLRSF